MEYSGAEGKLIHEENQRQKSRDTVPLKPCLKRIVYILDLTSLTAKYFKYFIWARYFKGVE